ncbi:hypothetical protein D3C72_1669090 [compost metagenome]
MCFNSTNGIHLSNDYLGPKALGPHRHTFTAPTISDNDNRLARNDQVGRTNQAIPCRLTGTIAIIEQIFTVSIVDSYHREFQGSLFLQCLQTNDPCGGLFCTAANCIQQVWTLPMQDRCEITAVIDNQIRLGLQSFNNKLLELHRIRVVFSKYGNSVFHQGCTDIILRR